MNRFLVLILLTSFSSPVFSIQLMGGADGAGGDNLRPETGSAWFLGQDTIKYCAVVDPKFGISPQAVYPELFGAFRTWVLYIVSHFPESRNVQYELALRSKYQACDGTEDLKFYFGGTNEEIEKAKALYDNPIGFAHRTSYDLKKAWGKGFVWIAPTESIDPKNSFPDWNSPHLLQGILLHELGHVYGCGHVEGTIMTERIAEFLKVGQTYPKLGSTYLSTVDVFRTLSPVGLAITKGHFGDQSKLTETEKLYETLVGRKPAGKILAEHIYNGEGISHLRLIDDKGVVVLPIKTQPEKDLLGYSLFPGDGKVFLKAWETANGTGQTYSLSYGYSTLGKITSLQGKEFPLSLEMNSLTVTTLSSQYFGGPLRLRVFLEDKVTDLFLQEKGASLRGK